MTCDFFKIKTKVINFFSVNLLKTSNNSLKICKNIYKIHTYVNFREFLSNFVFICYLSFIILNTMAIKFLLKTLHGQILVWKLKLPSKTAKSESFIFSFHFKDLITLVFWDSHSIHVINFFCDFIWINLYPLSTFI